MFISEEVLECLSKKRPVTIIKEKRKNKTLKRMLREIVKEANYLDVSMDELNEMLRKIHEEEREEG